MMFNLEIIEGRIWLIIIMKNLHFHFVKKAFRQHRVRNFQAEQLLKFGP